MSHSPPSPKQGTVAILGTRGYPSYYGGFETAVRKLAPYLVERGWDVVVYGRAQAVTQDGSTPDPHIRSVLTRGLEFRSLSTLSYGFTAALDATLRAKPDVILVMNVANGFFLPLFAVRGIPAVVNVDGIEWERAKWGRIAKVMFRLGARLTARYGTELVFDARAIEKRWKSDFARSGKFIPYGGTDPGQLPAPMGLASGSYALLVARFVPENTVAEFLEACTRIARDHPVVIVGSSGYGGELDEAAKSLEDTHDSVRWLGHVQDDALLFALFQHAGAYFHGHSVGGTNPALVQAMACGAAIVARDTVYNREVLGEDGTYVEPKPSSIADAVTAMISSLSKQRLARNNAKQRSQESYTWEGVCSAYEQTLRTQTSDKRTRR